MNKDEAIKRGARRVRRVAVPVVTTEQLVLIRDCLAKMERLQDELFELFGEFSANLDVLGGDTLPDGWRRPIVEGEDGEA